MEPKNISAVDADNSVVMMAFEKGAEDWVELGKGGVHLSYFKQ